MAGGHGGRGASRVAPRQETRAGKPGPGQSLVTVTGSPPAIGCMPAGGDPRAQGLPGGWQAPLQAQLQSQQTLRTGWAAYYCPHSPRYSTGPSRTCSAASAVAWRYTQGPTLSPTRVTI